jgi:hypothetical protein
MKKLFILLLGLVCLPMAFATDAVNIKIKINGASSNNRYFLCLPDIGCLSIRAAQKGKIYPIFHEIEMEGIYVTNVENMRVFPQGLPKSCDLSLETNKTLTISGHLVTGPNGEAKINNLSCQVT